LATQAELSCDRQNAIEILKRKLNFMGKKENLLRKKSSFLFNKYVYFYSLGLNTFKYRFFTFNNKNYVSTAIAKSIQICKKKLGVISKLKSKNRIKLESFESGTKVFYELQRKEKGKLFTHINDKIAVKTEFNRVLRNKIKNIETSSNLFNEKLELLLNFVLKRRIKRYSLKSKIFIDPRTKIKTVRKSPIIYFLTKRRLKKVRKF